CDMPRRDHASARQCSDKLLTLATEQGLALYRAVATIIRGWTLVHQGSVADGLAALRGGFADYCEISKLFRPYFGGVFADARLSANAAEDGMALLTEAMRLAEESREICWLAEMLNLRGKFLLLAGRNVDAEMSFHQALELAQRQSAHSLQLRAATSLARLYRDQGKRADARDRLAPVLGWFTEGFATPDLKEAKALLEHLPS